MSMDCIRLRTDRAEWYAQTCRRARTWALRKGGWTTCVVVRHVYARRFELCVGLGSGT